MSLNKNDILSVADCKTVSVDVPEWGGSVAVKQMTAGERDQWELYVGKHPEQTRASLAVFCLADDQGGRLFGIEDIEALSKKSASALDRLFDVAVKVNKLRKEDVDALEKK